LLTLPPPRLPFVCRVKESAALVLLPVSACRVVVAVGLVGLGGADELIRPLTPQAVSDRKHALARTTWIHSNVEGRRIEIIEEHLLREELQSGTTLTREDDECAIHVVSLKTKRSALPFQTLYHDEHLRILIAKLVNPANLGMTENRGGTSLTLRAFHRAGALELPLPERRFTVQGPSPMFARLLRFHRVRLCRACSLVTVMRDSRLSVVAFDSCQGKRGYDRQAERLCSGSKLPRLMSVI
jgi:hypothetical protein